MSKGQREMTYEELKYAYMILADYGIEVIEWITEQAERVQELEEENKQYREALEFYAEPKNWLPQNEDVLSLITMDYGEKARRTLEELE